MAPPAARNYSRGVRELAVLCFKFGKRFVATVLRINIKYQQIVLGTCGDTDIGKWEF